VRWGRWLLATLLGLVVAFGVGYLIAVFVIFPPLRTIAQGGVPVPKLAGLDYATATRTLSSLGLVLGDTMSLPNIVEPAGVVVAQSPLPGQQLKLGKSVRVALSSGRPRALLPDVKGFVVSKALTLLGSLGFQVTQRAEAGVEPAGHVVHVEPAPGVEYDVPSPVTLVVSSGLLLAPGADSSAASTTSALPPVVAPAAATPKDTAGAKH
jgi:serine/threonine-protein kinase